MSEQYLFQNRRTVGPKAAESKKLLHALLQCTSLLVFHLNQTGLKPVLLKGLTVHVSLVYLTSRLNTP